jgi:hypothetical protein
VLERPGLNTVTATAPGGITVAIAPNITRQRSSRDTRSGEDGVADLDPFGCRIEPADHGGRGAPPRGREWDAFSWWASQCFTPMG